MKGNIYVVSCYEEPLKLYVGSTQKTLEQRLQKHIYNYNMYLKGKYKYYSVFDMMKNNNHLHIELLDEIEFDDIHELKEKEYEYIKILQPLAINKKINHNPRKIQNVCCPCCNHQFVV